ncbi:helix-turn-helix domain-containing protein [Ahrensia marina]|uniref:GlxA family transcriptional regulator n=1 Tax=Ahrensia marina TaxID=1514904 RepID=UPI0035D11A9F
MSILDKEPSERTIDVLIFDRVNLLDVAGPVQAFDCARFRDARVYRHRYVSPDGRPVQANCGLKLQPDDALCPNSQSNDLLVPGGDGVDALTQDAAVLATVRAWAAKPRDSRLISICSGALLLAAAGVLDGQTATTHWSREPETRRHPSVQWDLDRICIAGAGIYTSAGVTTGIDLALSIIRADCGNASALAVARELVVQLRRTGGQSQYAMHLAGQFQPEDALAKLIEAVISNPCSDWSVEHLADAAKMNPRTLSRRFAASMDTTPARFVERVRVDHARGLLADGLLLKRVAVEAGFGDYQRMRRAFRRQMGVDPADFARTFG